MHRPIAALVWIALAFLAHAQPADPAARARQFLDLLAKKDGAAAGAMLDDKLKAALPPEKLAQIWPATEAQAGPFHQFGQTRVEPSATADVVFVTCEFTKFKLDARIPVAKNGSIAGINLSLHVDYTAPAYVQMSTFHEKQVIVGAGETALHGTLALPNGSGPFAAVVLVHGSGSYDADYSIGPNKLFRDIAWGLASRGIAVLRYNKRSFEHREQFANAASFTLNEEAVDDAVAAARLLRGMPEIDARKVFVLGHSLGAIVAPRIDQRDPALAGLILLGGMPGVFLDHMVPQAIHEMEARGAITPAGQKQIDALKQQVARAMDPNLKPGDPAAGLPFGISAAYWLDVRSYHPGEVARGLKQPMFILQGDRDYQITLDDFEQWKNQLADRKNVEYKLYPKLNHMFIEGEGPSSDMEYLKPGHVSAAVIDDVALWIKRQAK